MKKTILNAFLILVALLFGNVTAQADVVKGRVVDAETKEPLPEAQVTFETLDYGWIWAYFKTDSLGCFSINAEGRNTVTAAMLGYYSKKKTFLAFSDSRKDTLDLGDIELTMSPQMLKMVEVKGRARRFTVKGDTIVFHPEAFHLQEGARLDELIRQLPGVQVDENGTLSWNGKPIRITMGGQSLLGVMISWDSCLLKLCRTSRPITSSPRSASVRARMTAQRIWCSISPSSPASWIAGMVT